MEENLNWIDTLYEMNTEVRRNFVLLSNQGLAGDNQGNRFYETLLALVPAYDLVQFYLVQSGQREDLEIQSGYNGIQNLDVISMTNQAWPPLHVSIDTTDNAEDPISLGYEYWSDEAG